AVAINDRGMIAGTVGPTSNTPPATAVVWSTDGSVLRVLPRLPGAVQCQAMDISKHGDVVGFCSGAGSQQAVLWPFGGGVVSLPQLEGTDQSMAQGFNLRGDIVGRSTVIGVPWFHEPTLWTRHRGKDYSVTRVFAYHGE